MPGTQAIHKAGEGEDSEGRKGREGREFTRRRNDATREEGFFRVSVLGCESRLRPGLVLGGLANFWTGTMGSSQHQESTAGLDELLKKRLLSRRVVASLC